MFQIRPFKCALFFGRNSSKIFSFQTSWIIKVHLFSEVHKILRNLHRRFDLYYIVQIYVGDFAKFCGLLRIYELYLLSPTIGRLQNVLNVIKTNWMCSNNIASVQKKNCATRWIIQKSSSFGKINLPVTMRIRTPNWAFASKNLAFQPLLNLDFRII